MEQIAEKFNEIFKAEHENIYFAPGRVNLIGEHIDYNGGNVFPCALDFGTSMYVRRRNDKKVRLYSLNFQEKGIIEFSLDDLHFDKEDDWANYPKGVIATCEKAGHKLGNGFDALVIGTIPNGSGLSSSASIELVTSVFINDYYNFNLDMVELVKISQKAENEFIGVNCGIMDQFVIGMGKKDKAILLNCNTLEYKYAPVVLGDYALVIMNTNKRRELGESKYNERRSECESALAEFQKVLPIKNLCDLSVEQFEANKEIIKDEVKRKRAKHAVYENARTLNALKALEDGELGLFGQLMKESHKSLQYDYEVTGIELDTIVSLAVESEGVLGARMTGAGFGGCAVAIVNKGKIQNFIDNVGAKYKEKIGYEASFYTSGIGNGACKL